MIEVCEIDLGQNAFSSYLSHQGKNPFDFSISAWVIGEYIYVRMYLVIEKVFLVSMINKYSKEYFPNEIIDNLEPGRYAYFL